MLDVALTLPASFYPRDYRLSRKFPPTYIQKAEEMIASDPKAFYGWLLALGRNPCCALDGRSLGGMTLP